MQLNWAGMWLRFMLFASLCFALFLLGYFQLQADVPDRAIFIYKQRQLSQGFLGLVLLYFSIEVVLHRQLWQEKIRAWWLEPLPAKTLAGLRLIFYSTLATHMIFFAPKNWLPLASLPHEARQALPLMSWLVDSIPIHPSLYLAAILISAFLGILAMLGWMGAWPRILLIPLTFYTFGVPQFYGKLSHYQYFFWAACILAFAPTNDAWSLDAVWARITGKGKKAKAAFKYALPIRLIMLSLAGVYFFSGLRKIWEAGFYWFASDNPVNLFRTEWLEHFETLPMLRIDRFPLLCSIGAGLVILFELAYPFLLLEKKWRPWLALDAILFHTFNGIFLKIDFTYLKAAHLTYFDWEHWSRKWASLPHRLAMWAVLILLTATVGILLGVGQLAILLFFIASLDLLLRKIPHRKKVQWMWQIRQKWGSKRPSQERNWLKWNLRTGLTLVALNWTFSALGIHTWPISSYPTYSFVRHATVEYGWFIPENAQGQTIDLDEEAQKAGYRKEELMLVAEQIVMAARQDTAHLSQQVELAWQRWLVILPALQSANSAKVVARTYLLDPDVAEKVVEETTLGRMKKATEEWVFEPTENLPLPPSKY